MQSVGQIILCIHAFVIKSLVFGELLSLTYHCAAWRQAKKVSKEATQP